MEATVEKQARPRAGRAYLRRLPESGVVALWLAANLFILGAYTTYTLNRSMFPLPFGVMLQRYHLQPFAVTLGALILVALLAPTLAMYRAYLALLFAVALMVWIQGNFLVWNYGVFDGTAIDFTLHRGIGVGEVLLWLLVVVVMLKQRNRLHRHIPYLAGGLLLLQSGLAYTKETPPVKAKPPGRALDPTLARDRPEMVFDYSPAGNVIIYLSDGFQSDIFAEIIDGSRELADALEGFTFFADASTNSRLTVGAYPAILTGVMYDGSVPFTDYAKETFLKDNVGLALRRKGYEIAFVLESGNLFYQPEHCVRPFGFVDRFFADDLSSRALLDAALFRHSPHFLKPYVFDGRSGVAEHLRNAPARLQGGNQTTAYIDFLNVMDRRMQRRAGAPTFKLFHLLNAHPPISANESCEYERMSASRANYVRTNLCSLKLFVRFLSRLKSLGVYDSSTVVFLGDHGAKGVGTGLANVFEGLQSGDAWPALLIKPANQRGPLRRSQAPAQIADIAATIAQLTGVDATFPGRSLLSLAEGEARDRYFFLGKANERFERSVDKPPPRIDFLIRGPVKDPKSWSLFDYARTDVSALPPGVFSARAR